MTTVPEAAARTLVHNGVRHAFGVVGSGNIVATAALVAEGVEYIPARHEGGAIAMADAYYRATSDVAVCTTTCGPGLTNASTGLVEAAKNHSGLVLLAGDAPTTGPRPFDVDQQTITAGLGALSVRLTDPATATQTVAAALDVARTQRRPVVVHLPSDLAGVPAPGELAMADVRAAARIRPAAAEVDDVARVLAGSRRPLLLAGLGAWRSGAGKAITDLGDRLGALYATSLQGAGMFDGTGHSLGICGGFASPRAAALIGAADVVVVFGASLNEWTLHGGQLIDPEATVVQVDLADQPAPRADRWIRADALATASDVLDALNRRSAPRSTWRDEALGSLDFVEWKYHRYIDESTGDRMDPRTLSIALAGLLPRERTLVADGGHFIGWPAMYWPVPDPAALVYTGIAYQSIGLGFAGAVGAAIGRGDRTTVVAVGDGGAMMGLPELETLSRTGRSALVVVFNDAAYGAEVHMYGPRGVDLSTVLFDDTDFAAIARSFGASAATVRTTADLGVVREWRSHGCRGTLLLDCKIVRSVTARYLAEVGERLLGAAGSAD